MSYDKKSKKIYAPCDKLPESFRIGVPDDDLEKEFDALALLLMKGWTCVAPKTPFPKLKDAEQAADEYYIGGDPYIETPAEEWKKEGFVDGYEEAVEAINAIMIVARDLVNAVEKYVEPKPGDKYMHRTKVLAIKNKLKEMLK
jgi:hypothetical protein